MSDVTILGVRHVLSDVHLNEWSSEIQASLKLYEIILFNLGVCDNKPGSKS